MTTKKISAIIITMALICASSGCAITEKQVRARVADQLQLENTRKNKVFDAEMTRMKQIEQMSHTADFGPIPKNYKDLARVAILSRLKDPYSPEILFDKGPYKSFLPHYMLRQAMEQAGYDPNTGTYDYNKNMYVIATKARTLDDLPAYDTTIKPGDVEYVWKVDAYVNAKNNFGAYTGLKKWTVSMKNGEIIEVGPSDSSSIDFDRMRVGIAGTENMLRKQKAETENKLRELRDPSK